MFVEDRTKILDSSTKNNNQREPLSLQKLRRQIIGTAFSYRTSKRQAPIFCFSSPRSGSTLLREFFNTFPGVITIAEPLNVNDPLVRDFLGVADWREATLLEDRETLYGRYFDQILSGRLAINNPAPWRDQYKFRYNRFYFQIIHGGEDMLDWFASRFNGHLMHIVRHPIPTALSHWRLPRLQGLIERPSLRAMLTPEQIAFVEKTILSGSAFELAILDWCLQNLPILSTDLAGKGIRIAYEDFVVRPDAVYETIRDSFLLPDCPESKLVFYRPSRTTIPRSQSTMREMTASDSDNRELLITKWKNNVSSDQINWTQETLDIFNIEIYRADSPYPQTDLLGPIPA